MTGPGPRPPRLAEWLVSVVLTAAGADETIGDLHERYRASVVRDGRASAARWYVRQAAGFIVRVPAARVAVRAAGLAHGTFGSAGLGAELRQAVRASISERAFTVTVVVVLGLAVGATTLVFSLVHGVLLQPLPFAAPHELVMVWDEYPVEDAEATPKPATELHVRAWRARTDLFAGVAAYDSFPAVIDAGRWSERIDAAFVSADLLPLLGVEPSIGRHFTREDDAPGAAPVVILSDGLWRSHFGADATVVGRTMAIDGEPARIIGVMPAGFWFYDPYASTRSYGAQGASAARLWRPLAGRFADEPDYPRYRVIARLRPDVGWRIAAAAIAATERNLPLSPPADGRVRVVPLGEQAVAAVRPRLVGLSGAVLLVLVVALVNIVGLFVAGLDARRPEFAIRAALGAGRGRLLRALLVRGALLAAGGAAAGLGLAAAGLPVLVDLVPRGLPLAHRVGLDATVVGFACVASLSAMLVVAAIVGWKVTAPAGPGSSRTVAGGGGRLMAGTVVAEVALSLVLLVSATLLLRSLMSVGAIDPGFDRRDTLTFRSLLLLPAISAPPDFTFFDRLETRLAQLPGVVAAGSGTVVPFSRWASTVVVRPSGEAGPTAQVDYRLVSPGYFETLRIRAQAGRLFTAADGPGAPPVAVVNRAFADRYLADGAPAVGRRLPVARGRREIDRLVVGIVGDVREARLTSEARPILYAPLAQSPMPMRQFVLRTSVPPGSLVEAVRETAAAIDPRQPLQEFITLEALVGQSLEEERFYAVLAGVFAVAAVLLALVGLYGVVSSAVTRRRREVGVRMALGAGPGAVYRLVLTDGLRPVVAGLALGCAGAIGAATFVESLLHGVAPVDVTSYAMATTLFLGVAAMACALPARRAAAIDPVRVLR